jgi:hypothetical protein
VLNLLLANARASPASLEVSASDRSSLMIAVAMSGQEFTH